MAGLVWWVSLRQIFPRSSSPENPKYAVQYLAQVITYWPASTFKFLRGLGQQRSNPFPLFIGDIHALFEGKTGEKSKKFLGFEQPIYERIGVEYDAQYAMII